MNKISNGPGRLLSDGPRVTTARILPGSRRGPLGNSIESDIKEKNFLESTVFFFFLFFFLSTVSLDFQKM